MVRRPRGGVLTTSSKYCEGWRISPPGQEAANGSREARATPTHHERGERTGGFIVYWGSSMGRIGTSRVG